MDHDGDEETGSGSGTKPYKNKIYVEVLPQEFKSVLVVAGNFVKSERNILDITLECDTLIPGSNDRTMVGTSLGGRIVIEFPVSFFDDDFGLGYKDDDSVPCVAQIGDALLSDYWLEDIKCIFQQGNADSNEPAKIFVTNFVDIAANTIIRFFITNFKNPAGSVNTFDQRIFSIRIYATEIINDFPGSKICQSYVQNLGYLIDTAIPTTAADPDEAADPYLNFETSYEYTDQYEDDSATPVDVTYTLRVPRPVSNRPRSNPGTAGWSSGDYILIDLPRDFRLNNENPDPDIIPSCEEESGNLCILDRFNNILLVHIKDSLPAVTDTSTLITIHGVRNPIHDFHTDPKATSYYMQERMLSQKQEHLTFLDDLLPIEFGTSPDFIRVLDNSSPQVYYEDGTYDLMFTIKPDLEIAAGGIIVFDFEMTQFTLEETACANYFDSKYAGSYSCTIDSARKRATFELGEK